MSDDTPMAHEDAHAPDTGPTLDGALIPRATYRLQFHAGMRFEQATQLVPYLAELGVSHLYASPYLKARAGSTHGYDVVDHNALNPEIGSEEEHAALCDALARHGMHQLLDIVPNHMGVLEADNGWWLDVLENGAASAHAQTFDIDWHPAAPELAGRLLLPVLGDHYGRVLEAGEMTLAFDPAAGSFAVRYFDHRFPVDPQHYPDILDAAAMPTDGVSTRDAMEVRALIDAFGRLPARDAPDARAGRADKALLHRRLSQHHAGDAWLREWIEACLAAFDADRLDALIERQAWRPSFWRTAGDEVNYRRFFDVSTLAAVRMERDEVFDATHATLLRWLQQGQLAGLRIDHPDGLADPHAYLQRLQAAYRGLHRASGEHGEAAGAPHALYVSVEKILAEHEHLPRDWAAHGGTGYRFANQVHGLFVQSAHEAAFDDILQRFTGDDTSFDEMLDTSKRLVMATSLAADLQLLTQALHRVAQADRRTRDFTRNQLRQALVDLAAAFPVYRTYIRAGRAGDDGIAADDVRHVERATAAARRRIAPQDTRALDFVREVLLTASADADDAQRARKLAFVTRWQQFTAPVMAKSMEDTAFYRYHRLVSLNDVGGEPRRFGMSVAAFHAANSGRLRRHPHAMLATSTHDSKRSEDVRARLAVLSEMPQAWSDAVMRWSALNRPRELRDPTSTVQLSAADEYLLYQTLVGVWPLQPPDDAALGSLRERVQAYMLKAVREAKVRSSWIHPDAGYEAALAGFVDRAIGIREPNPFLSDLQAFVADIVQPGCINGLNQLLLKLTVPGVPDVYQGCERWNLSLVDPDNRQPVDFASLQADLTDLKTWWADGAPSPQTLRALIAAPADGRIKLLVTWRLLTLRREQAALFEFGDYRPLIAEGAASDHVVAFSRRHQQACCVVLGNRLPWTLRHAAATRDIGWSDTTIALPAMSSEGHWVDAISGRRTAAEAGIAPSLELSAAWESLPVAALLFVPG